MSVIETASPLESPEEDTPVTETPVGSTRQAPGLPAKGFLGHVSLLREDVLGTLDRTFETYGDVTSFRFGPARAFLLAHPDHIEHVLLRNWKQYDKGVLSYKQLKAVLGEGLVTSDGELWQRQRRIAQPGFQRGRLLRFGPVMTRAAEEILEEWRGPAARGEAVDVHRAMMRLALLVAGETLFGADVRGAADVVAQGLEDFLDDYQTRVYSLFLMLLPSWVPIPRNLRRRRTVRMLDRVVLDVIEKRRRDCASPPDSPQGDPGKHDDLLAMLMSARDEETGEGMNDRQLRDEVMTILMAGHETTANALAWTFYLLSQHPEVAERLRGELARVLGGRVPTTDDLPQLTYTKMVLEESMRLYPPVWMVERRALEDDEIGGYHIPAKSIVMMSPWVTHRHPGLWDDPKSFDPERFDPDRSIQRHRFAYFPFGGGPRVCIGGPFAMIEARLVIATLAQHYRFELEGEHPELDPSVTLRPRNGLRMRLLPLE